MRLSKSTDIAIGIVVCLSTSRGALMTTHEAAERLMVRYTHAAKVVSRLVDLGLIDARRGRGGGLAITEVGSQVTVGWLVREFQHLEHDTDQTPGPGSCRLVDALRQAQAAFWASLDGVRVCDLEVPACFERPSLEPARVTSQLCMAGGPVLAIAPLMQGVRMSESMQQRCSVHRPAR
ncbi:RrF2 family transcriptional regulator [Streptomyces sp. NBC_00271]|uniref:RrF2 family transcriptional regulator n=1 Tax=Streptomyces sp. NBC_00271 TaxID=2975697 RepID=UPI002E29B4BB|nr:Rrf2 family transcriptional regulator [Streptomyces sp. NBC_00271]